MYNADLQHRDVNPTNHSCLARLGFLTGLYSAFSNPLLEHLEYGMANMSAFRATLGRLGQLFRRRSNGAPGLLLPPASPLVPNGPDGLRRSFGPGGPPAFRFDV